VSYHSQGRVWCVAAESLERGVDMNRGSNITMPQAVLKYIMYEYMNRGQIVNKLESHVENTVNCINDILLFEIY
jgi:hypothetical protein